MARGLDYSDYPHPSTAAIKADGASFVCRYVSDYAPADTCGKNLLPGEKDVLLGAGISIVVVHESTASRMLGGASAGTTDAQYAEAVVKALGMAGIPVYFACDWDASSAQQAAINGYLDGAAAVIGRGRTGIYGGYYPVSRALDAGKATYGWQTYAWSGGQWDTRAQLRQVQNDVTVGGASCDRDTAMAADYGQWPRPGGFVTLAEGASGAGVSAAQNALNSHGATPAVVVDGAYGPATVIAVRAFQAGHYLTVDGIIGPATWAALSAAVLKAGQLAAPGYVSVDRKRLPIQWAAVPGAHGYTAVAYAADGTEHARAVTVTATWAVLDGLTPGTAYTIRVWANGGSVAPGGTDLHVTMPA
jgi:Rv2525c-like, glycoside hydrolase-like domain/Putative peptidoglycan binding domain